MPLITAMSGNVAVQCSTIIVRGLATGYINISTPVQILLKEIRIGFFIAVTCGIVAGFSSYFFISNNIKLGFTVGISMLVCLIFASITGTSGPLMLKKLNLDPAISSGPIVTTLNDISALIIYFSLALYILL